MTKSDIERKLYPYRCRYVDALPDGTEIWTTGWGHIFTLSPEAPDGKEPRYDAWQLQRVMAGVIALTMPPGFDIAVPPVERVRPKIVRS